MPTTLADIYCFCQAEDRAAGPAVIVGVTRRKLLTVLSGSTYNTGLYASTYYWCVRRAVRSRDSALCANHTCAPLPSSQHLFDAAQEYDIRRGHGDAVLLLAMHHTGLLNRDHGCVHYSSAPLRRIKAVCLRGHLSRVFAAASPRSCHWYFDVVSNRRGLLWCVPRARRAAEAPSPLCNLRFCDTPHSGQPSPLGDPLTCCQPCLAPAAAGAARRGTITAYCAASQSFSVTEVQTCASSAASSLRDQDTEAQPPAPICPSLIRPMPCRGSSFCRCVYTISFYLPQGEQFAAA